MCRSVPECTPGVARGVPRTAAGTSAGSRTMYRPDITNRCNCPVRQDAGMTRRGGGPRARGPRTAPRCPDARLRAAQAAQRPARLGPRPVLRHALPCLKRCSPAAATSSRTPPARPRRRRRGRRDRQRPIVYRLTAEGKECFARLLRAPGPARGRTRLRRPVRVLRPHRLARSGCGSSRAVAPGSRSASRRRAQVRRQRDRVDAYTAGAAAARPRVGRARGHLADRADRRRTLRATRPHGPPTGTTQRHDQSARHAHE